VALATSLFDWSLVVPVGVAVDPLLATSTKQAVAVAVAVKSKSSTLP